MPTPIIEVDNPNEHRKHVLAAGPISQDPGRVTEIGVSTDAVGVIAFNIRDGLDGNAPLLRRIVLNTQQTIEFHPRAMRFSNALWIGDFLGVPGSDFQLFVVYETGSQENKLINS